MSSQHQNRLLPTTGVEPNRYEDRPPHFTTLTLFLKPESTHTTWSNASGKLLSGKKLYSKEIGR